GRRAHQAARAPYGAEAVPTEQSALEQRARHGISRRRSRMRAAIPSGLASLGTLPGILAQAEKAKPLAQRVAVDPEEAGRLPLIPPRQLERLPQERPFNTRHDAPVESAVFRHRHLANE